jgi:beta-glucosidase
VATGAEAGRFPANFIWGVATAAHQIEGGNFNNDWWVWEHDPASGCAESSGDACDSYHRWHQDVDLVARLGLGAYRFSLEWSRIEPAPGEFSTAALAHYRGVCEACWEREIEPVVTFHHYTLPRWLADRGGWEWAEAPERFARFVTRAGAYLGEVIGRACTINEPNVVGVLGYTLGEFPPGVKDDLRRHLAVNDTMVRAHRLAVDALRSGPGRFPVGITLSMAELVADEGGESVRDAAEEILENGFLRATGGDDFVGVQCYTRIHLGPEGKAADDPTIAQTQMGYEYWPQAVEYTVRRAANYSGIPVIVTENGIATDDDTQRIRYMAEALSGVSRCLDDGIDVRGYFAWSLLDNFEWTHGFKPKFGLYEVDRETFERRPKPSAQWLAGIAQANTLGPDNGSGRQDGLVIE